MKFTTEQIAKAKNAASVEELLAFAKRENVELTREEAEEYFKQLTPSSGPLSDDEIEMCVGGGCGNSSKSQSPTDYGFPNGSRVYYHNGICGECPKYGHKNPSKNFTLEWVDYPGGKFRLRCDVCGSVKEYSDNFFTGDPRAKGMSKVG